MTAKSILLKNIPLFLIIGLVINYLPGTYSTDFGEWELANWDWGFIWPLLILLGIFQILFWLEMLFGYLEKR